VTKQAKAKWLEDNLAYLYGNGGVADYPIIPSQPRSLAVVYDSENDQFDFTWNAPLSDGGSALTEYNFYVNGAYVNSPAATEFTNIDNGTLVSDGDEIYVTAVNSLGESGRSNTVTAEVS